MLTVIQNQHGKPMQKQRQKGVRGESKLTFMSNQPTTRRFMENPVRNRKHTYPFAQRAPGYPKTLPRRLEGIGLDVGGRFGGQSLA